MASNINTSALDTGFPVAGTNNSTLGFRENFANIKANLDYAKLEISDLQSKAVLKAALNGISLNNDVGETVIANATLRSARTAISDLGVVSGVQKIDYSVGNYVLITTDGIVTLNFTNWPTAGIAGAVRVVITVASTLHTVVLPAVVSQGLSTVANAVTTVKNDGTIDYTTISFVSTGTYVYDFESHDHGTTVMVIAQLGATTGSGSTSSTLFPATTTRLGGVKVGSGLAAATDGTLRTNLTSANLPIATAAALGGVKIGSGLSVALDGTISVGGGGGSSPPSNNSLVCASLDILKPDDTDPLLVPPSNAWTKLGVSLRLPASGAYRFRVIGALFYYISAQGSPVPGKLRIYVNGANASTADIQFNTPNLSVVGSGNVDTYQDITGLHRGDLIELYYKFNTDPNNGVVNVGVGLFSVLVAGENNFGIHALADYSLTTSYPGIVRPKTSLP